VNYQKIVCEPGYTLVKVLDLGDDTGGLIVPASEKEKTNIGEVLWDGGLDRQDIKNQYGNENFSPGTVVIFARWGGVELSDPEYKIFKRSEIYAQILEEKK